MPGREDGAASDETSTSQLLRGMPEDRPSSAPAEVPSRESWRNWAAWWVLGLTNNVGYVVFLTAAEAIISGGAGVVLLADILPVLVIKPTAPFWAHYMSYPVRYALCTLFAAASFLLAALCEPVALKLMGVACAAVSSGWGEVTSLGMLAFYKESAVTAWASGTGAAGIVGAGFYVFFTSALGLDDRTTLLVGLMFPVAYAAAFFVALGPATAVPGAELGDGGTSVRSGGGRSDGASDGAGAVGAAVSSDGMGPVEMGPETPAAPEHGPLMPGRAATRSRGIEASDATKRMSVVERLLAARGLLPVMASLFVVYLAEYTISSGVAGTLSFPADGLPKHEFYGRAQLVYQVGVFVSRSSGTHFPIDVLWPMPLAQAINLALFVTQSCTQLVGSSWAVLLFVLVEGLLGGAVYVNAFRKLRAQSPPAMREFYLGAASVADTAGIAVAGGISTWLEPFLNGVRAARGLPVA